MVQGEQNRKQNCNRRFAGFGQAAYRGGSVNLPEGLIHLLVTLEYYGFAAYLGLLMIANFAGSMVSAVGVYKGRVWGWWLGAVMAAGAFLAYVESRTLGLPGLPSWEPFTEPPGLLSLLVEAIFLGLAVYVLLWKREATASSGGAM